MSLVGTGCGDGDVAAIAAAPAARALTSLHLAGPGVTLEAVRALARSAGLGCLRELGLYRIHLFADGPEPAGEPAALQGLTALELENCQLNSEGARALEGCLDFMLLQTLSLDSCTYDSEGGQGGWAACIRRWAAVAEGLTSLDLAFNHLRSAELEEVLRDVAGLRELSLLRLSGSFGMQGAIVARLARLPRLTALDLAGTRAGDTGAAALASSAGFSALRRVNLDRTSITVEGLRDLTASPVVKELVDLSLADNSLKDKGAAVLAVAPRLAKLTRLCLGGNGVGDGGALALATSRTLRELVILALEGGSQLTAVGSDHLAFSTSLISLKHVYCTPNIWPGADVEEEQR